MIRSNKSTYIQVENAYVRLDCKSRFGSVHVDTPLSDAAGVRIYQLTDPTQDITILVTSRRNKSLTHSTHNQRTLWAPMERTRQYLQLFIDPKVQDTRRHLETSRSLLAGLKGISVGNNSTRLRGIYTCPRLEIWALIMELLHHITSKHRRRKMRQNFKHEKSIVLEKRRWQKQEHLWKRRSHWPRLRGIT